MLSASGKGGFTLIEMIVAVAIFVVVVVIATGALLSVIDANRKSQSIKSVMNNLHFAVEGMARNIRVGSNYDNGGVSGSSPQITFLDQNGDTVIYRRNALTLEREKNGEGFVAVTAPEVVIDDLRFYVDGEAAGDNLQPRVTIIIKGHVGTQQDTRTDFNIETMVSQRLIDS